MLSFEAISSTKSPQQWIFFIHGFLGSGANWRTFARRLVEQNSSYGAVLIDLRMHGRSQDFKEPHTISSTAYDLIELAREFKEPVRTIVGHSFGGKVALSFVEQYHEQLDIAWIVDSVPWAIDQKITASDTYKILDILTPLCDNNFSSRNIFIATLENLGLSKNIAQWLAMNLENISNSFYLRINPKILKILLDDYFSQDFLNLLSNTNIKTKIYFVLGAKSASVSTQDREHIIAITNKYPGRLQSYIISRAGHYVHVDNPEELLLLVEKSLNYLKFSKLKSPIK